jgi:SAM-dependent methyltransferase
VEYVCQNCGCALAQSLAGVRDPLTGESFGIYTCYGCGLGHTVPQPDDLKSYYPPGYYGNRHGPAERHCIRRRLRLVAAAMGGKGRTGRLLDVGCGDGAFPLAALRAGWEVVGTELEPRLAQEAGLDVRESIAQAADRAPVDCITLWHSLEHMRDIRETLAQAAKLLKPDGRMIIAVPDRGGFQARFFKRWWLHLDVPRHLYHFDKVSLCACLQQAGFSVRQYRHQEFEYDLLGWAQSALNVLFANANVFLNQLTGRRPGPGPFTRAASFILGSVLLVFSLPAVALGTMCGRGGALVAVAALRHGGGAAGKEGGRVL